VEKALGIKPIIAREPMHGAALGAVTMGLAELARRGRRVTVGGVLIPAPNVFIQEVTAHPLGVTVVLPGSSKLVLSVIVPRGHPYPCDITRKFQLAVPNATSARIEVLQGDPDAARELCVILGSVEMDGLPPIGDRPHALEIRFRLDVDGVAWVTARDVESGKLVEMKVDTKKVPPIP
jgi:molecular chaperone DnaK (HSP70)